MRIYSLWISRRGCEGDAPEMLVAWDEYTHDYNPDGYVAACEQALQMVGSDVVEKRHLILQVPDHEVSDAFRPVRVAARAEVSPEQQ